MEHEIAELRAAANDLAAQGYVVEALCIDDIAWLLEAGHSWNQLLDDVSVRPPYVN